MMGERQILVMPLYMKYGNTIETVKHVVKIAILFWLILVTIFASTAYLNGKLNSLSNLIYVLMYPLIVASMVPFIAWITTLLNIVIEEKTVSLLVLYKIKYNPQPIDRIMLVKIGRGLFHIYFEDGSSIKSLGMYLPELFRLVKDIRALKSTPLKVTSSWLSIE
jgi:hypothetical protein